MEGLGNMFNACQYISDKAHCDKSKVTKPGQNCQENNRKLVPRFTLEDWNFYLCFTFVSVFTYQEKKKKKIKAVGQSLGRIRPLNSLD